MDNAHILNIIGENERFIYVSPQIMNSLIPQNVSKDDIYNQCFINNMFNRLDNGNIYITREDYVSNVFIRYLCCAGRVEDLYIELNDVIRRKNDIMADIQLFLNRTDIPGFEYTTILDNFILWNDDRAGVNYLHNNGAITHIHYYNIVNTIHNMQWTNPFETFFNMVHLPTLLYNEITYNNNINEEYRNFFMHNNINIVLRRHIAHFINNVRFVNDNRQFNNQIVRVNNFAREFDNNNIIDLVDNIHNNIINERLIVIA